MVQTGLHGQSKILPKFQSLLLPNCKVEFLDSQVTGAVYMVQKTYGGFPELDDDRGRCDAAKKLESLATFGGIIVDTMGLGKTYLALLYLNLMAVHGRRDSHRPSLILTPSGIVLSQWAIAISKSFPDLNLIVAHGGKPTSLKYANAWVSGKAMEMAPTNLSKWPRALRYVFDKTDPRASRTVILSSYETFASRTLTTILEQIPGRKDKTIYRSNWNGVFECAILDEGHKLRHPWTKTYAAVKGLSVDTHWFLTATPVVNSSLVGLTISYQYEHIIDDLNRTFLVCLCSYGHEPKPS